MNEIRFRLRLRSRPRWRSLQRSTDTLAGFKGTYFQRKGGEEGWEGRAREEREEMGKEGAMGEEK